MPCDTSNSSLDLLKNTIGIKTIDYTTLEIEIEIFYPAKLDVIIDISTITTMLMIVKKNTTALNSLYLFLNYPS